MTERAWSANVKCLSLTLKEQSAEIKYVGVFTYPIVTFLTVENRGLPKTKIVSECRKSRDFPQLIFDFKHSTWAPYEQAKTVSRTVSFSRRYLNGFR